MLIHTVSLLQAVHEMVVDGRLNFSLGPSIKDIIILSVSPLCSFLGVRIVGTVVKEFCQL